MLLRRSLHALRRVSSISSTSTLRLTCNLRSRRAFSDYPEHEVIGLPALSPSVETSKIVKWTKAEGDFIAADEVIAIVQTDKAEIDWPSVDEAYLAKILLPEGQEVPINTPACIFVDEQSQVAAFANYVSGGGSPAAASPSSPPPPATESSSPPPPPAASASYPEHSVLTIPALSPTAETGTVVEWLVKEGDEVEANQGIAEVQTDKAIVTWETLDDGFVAKLLFPSDKEAAHPVGTPALVLVEDSSMISAFSSYTADAASGSPSPAAAAPETPAPSQPAQQTQAAPPSTASHPSAASPYAKSLARERGMDLSTIGSGSGPGGRIVAKDVLSATKTAPVSAAAPTSAAPAAAVPKPLALGGDRSFVDTDVTNMRAVIAKRLCDSKFSAPHFYVTCEFEMDKLIGARKDLNAMMSSKVSVNDFIIKAMALAARDVSDVNTAWLGDKIRKYNYVDVSVAVATPTGLITPIVKDADLKGLGLISSEMKDLASRAKDNKLGLDEFVGGSITLSNMGMMDVSQFTAIINPPQSIILAVGNAVPTLKPADNEKGFKTVTIMKATLSCDHRTVDGAKGAEYMQALRKYVENPAAMMF